MICLNRGLPLVIALTPSHISTNIGLLTNLSSVVTRNTMGSPPLDKCTRTAPTCLLQNFAIVDRDKQMSEARTFSIIVIGVALLIGSIQCISVSRVNTIYLYYIILYYINKYICMCAFLRQCIHLCGRIRINLYIRGHICVCVRTFLYVNCI